jgi:hypothetical protein
MILSARGYVSPVSHFGGPINGEESRLGSACVPPDDHVSANVAPSLGIQDSSSSKQIKVPTVSDGSNFPLSNVSRSPLNSIQDTQIEKVTSRENKLHKKKAKASWAVRFSKLRYSAIVSRWVLKIDQQQQLHMTSVHRPRRVDDHLLYARTKYFQREIYLK